MVYSKYNYSILYKMDPMEPIVLIQRQEKLLDVHHFKHGML